MLDRNHERITNEARALKLISKRTNIPVPKLIEHGTNPDGTRYIVTERIAGIALNTFLHRKCSYLEKHTNAIECTVCRDKAYKNALHFIESIVLPQLEQLKSTERGLEGFVMPPRWLNPDARPPFVGRGTPLRTLPQEKAKYVFQHGDLAAHNIIMDPRTLEVKALIDWEYAGYFLPGWEGWPGTLSLDDYHGVALDVAHGIENFLAEDYLASFDAWANKEELNKLVKDGELPDPERLKSLVK
jgi:aminoglycoside phosphotransferase